MAKNNTRRKKDIKSKLIAAICMLLVSSIMMVSSTYAWFTLSTAPEVTGIQTAVGANGNLEMALQPAYGDSSKITSSVGDSNLAANLANITWGNLVDLSSNEFYGLNNIMLYPAQLNTTETANGTAIATNPLATPAYGADGRVSALETKTLTGIFLNGKFEENANAFGVRAVGTSSGMSDRQLAYRAALQAANTAMSQAQRVAAQSLNNNGAKLADIAIKHATSTTDEKYTVAEVESLLVNVYELLGYDTGSGETAVHTTGALEYIEESLVQYALASVLAQKASDDDYTTYVNAFKSAEADDLVSLLSTYTTTNAGITEAVVKELTDAITNVTTAKTTLEALVYGADGLKGTTDDAATGATFTWAQISPALTELANPSSMQVNGIAVSDLKGNWKVDAATYYDAGNAEEVTVLVSGTPSTKSVSAATINSVSYYVDAEGYVYEASLKTEDDGDSGYPIVQNMSRLVDAVLNDGIQLIIASGAGVYADVADFCGDYSAAVKLSQISYGGMTVKNLDAKMSTKTNVTPVYLENAKTGVGTYQAGVGSSSVAISDFYGYIIDLAFRTNAADSDLMLQQEGVDRIYSDGKNEATMGGGATMSFTATDTKFSATQVKSLMSCIRIVFFNTDNGVIIGEARLDAESAIADTNGKITMELRMWDSENNAWAASQKIMALEQNTITELSVMVYLDGATITNADVANAVSSMTGSMNLQFSSSASLTPMDYTPLKEGTVTTYDVTVNGTKYGTATGGASYNLDLSAYATNYTITDITMGGTSIMGTAYDAATKKLTIDNVTGDIVVTVTENAASGG